MALLCLCFSLPASAARSLPPSARPLASALLCLSIHSTVAMSIPSTFLCSISGTVPSAPVVSRLSGLMFERRLIEAQLAASGPVCPVTGGPLTVADLLPVQSGLKGGVAAAGGVAANEVVKPRPPTATSIPGLLSLLQGEWDACMLETFHLKQQVRTTTEKTMHSTALRWRCQTRCGTATANRL